MMIRSLWVNNLKKQINHRNVCILGMHHNVTKHYVCTAHTPFVTQLKYFDQEVKSYVLEAQ